MRTIEINNPFDGLPVTLTIFQDGTFSATHLVTHEVIAGRFEDGYIRIPVEFCEKGYSIPANEAAEELGVSRMRITQLCNEGKLRSAMIGSSLFVCNDDVLQYAKSDRTPGRKENHA